MSVQGENETTVKFDMYLSIFFYAFTNTLKLKWILSLRLKGKSLEKQSIPDCHKGVLTLILP